MPRARVDAFRASQKSDHASAFTPRARGSRHDLHRVNGSYDVGWLRFIHLTGGVTENFPGKLGDEPRRNDGTDVLLPHAGVLVRLAKCDSGGEGDADDLVAERRRGERSRR